VVKERKGKERKRWRKKKEEQEGLKKRETADRIICQSI